jgi:tripartite-type tricarboxylate transporter receptor subunit TctC
LMLGGGPAWSASGQPSAGEGREKYPNRPITVIVGFGAGGQTDIAVRLIAKVAEKELGVPILVVNKPGGGGTVSVTQLARTEADGYTLGIITAQSIAAPFMERVAFDPFKDFEWLNAFGWYRYGIYAKADAPFHTLKDVVEGARKSPGKLTFGSTSLISALGLKFVEAQDNVKLTYIPLKSGQEVMTSLLGGHTNFGIGTPDAAEAFLAAKELKALAVVTPDRWEMLRDTPTLKELGYDIDTTGWMILGAPAGTPKYRLDILNAAWQHAHASPEVKDTLGKLKLWAPWTAGEQIKEVYPKKVAVWRRLLEKPAAPQR